MNHEFKTMSQIKEMKEMKRLKADLQQIEDQNTDEVVQLLENIGKLEKEKSLSDLGYHALCRENRRLESVVNSFEYGDDGASERLAGLLVDAVATKLSSADLILSARQFTDEGWEQLKAYVTGAKPEKTKNFVSPGEMGAEMRQAMNCLDSKEVYDPNVTAINRLAKLLIDSKTVPLSLPFLLEAAKSWSDEHWGAISLHPEVVEMHVNVPVKLDAIKISCVMEDAKDARIAFLENDIKELKRELKDSEDEVKRLSDEIMMARTSISHCSNLG